MRRKLSLLLFCSLCSILGFSQQCASDSLMFYPSGDIVYTGQGFSDPGNLPCASTGAYSEIVIPFKTYNQGARLLTLADSTAVPVSRIYAVRIDNITNLPSGLCWTTRSLNNTTSGDQVGALIIKGTTSAAMGTYPLNVTLSVDVNGSGSFTYTGLGPANYRPLLGQAVLRVADASGNCPSSN